jgi:hypothetical protein
VPLASTMPQALPGPADDAGSPKTAAPGGQEGLTAAEKTLRYAPRLERLAAREARDKLRRTTRVESTTGGCSASAKYRAWPTDLAATGVNWQ